MARVQLVVAVGGRGRAVRVAHARVRDGLEADVQVPHVRRQAAARDSEQRREAELGQVELLVPEEFAREAGKQRLLNVPAAQPQVAQLDRREVLADAQEQLERQPQQRAGLGGVRRTSCPRPWWKLLAA